MDRLSIRWLAVTPKITARFTFGAALAFAAGCFDVAEVPITDDTTNTSTNTIDTTATSTLTTSTDQTNTASTVDTQTNQSTSSGQTETPTNSDSTTEQGSSTTTSTDSGECNAGAQRTCDEHPGKDGLGICTAGLQACVFDDNGQLGWGDCAGSVGPQSADSCSEGADENCNGIPNEGCSCSPGESRSCGPAEVGICRSGIQNCDAGTWGDCEGAVHPTKRDCSSANDNDCDGAADNTIDTICQCAANAVEACNTHSGLDGVGACKAGSKSCVVADTMGSSQWSGCSGDVGPVAQDNCTTKTDANCDGALSCDCTPNEVTACGQCNEGKQTCSASGTWGACEDAGGEKVTYYRDADKDGHGDLKAPLESCDGQPTGYVKSSDDCCDHNINVFPGQDKYFEVAPLDCGLLFDYDCDQKESYEGTSYLCPQTGTCPSSYIRNGWSSAKKICGESQKWWICQITGGNGGCNYKTEDRVVACK